jgi:hypothetical protein
MSQMLQFGYLESLKYKEYEYKVWVKEWKKGKITTLLPIKMIL